MTASRGATVAEIYDIPNRSRRRDAARVWYREQTSRYAKPIEDPSNDIVDQLLEAERLLRQITGRAA